MEVSAVEILELSCGLQAELHLGDREIPEVSSDPRRSFAVQRSRERRQPLPDQFDTF
jgi:hypothetical protein